MTGIYKINLLILKYFGVLSNVNKLEDNFGVVSVNEADTHFDA